MSNWMMSLTRIQEAGVPLNASKCEFSVPIIKFLGHVIDAKEYEQIWESLQPFEMWNVPQTSLRYEDLWVW